MAATQPAGGVGGVGGSNTTDPSALTAQQQQLIQQQQALQQNSATFNQIISTLSTHGEDAKRLEREVK